MLNAGSDMSASDYGQALLIMGDYENRVGESEHKMIKEAYVKFVKPFADAAGKEGAINVSVTLNPADFSFYSTFKPEEIKPKISKTHFNI